MEIWARGELENGISQAQLARSLVKTLKGAPERVALDLGNELLNRQVRVSANGLIMEEKSGLEILFDRFDEVYTRRKLVAQQEIIKEVMECNRRG